MLFKGEVKFFCSKNGEKVNKPKKTLFKNRDFRSQRGQKKNRGESVALSPTQNEGGPSRGLSITKDKNPGNQKKSNRKTEKRVIPVGRKKHRKKPPKKRCNFGAKKKVRRGEALETPDCPCKKPKTLQGKKKRIKVNKETRLSRLNLY